MHFSHPSRSSAGVFTVAALAAALLLGGCASRGPLPTLSTVPLTLSSTPPGAWMSLPSFFHVAVRSDTFLLAVLTAVKVCRVCSVSCGNCVRVGSSCCGMAPKALAALPTSLKAPSMAAWFSGLSRLFTLLVICSAWSRMRLPRFSSWSSKPARRGISDGLSLLVPSSLEPTCSSSSWM